MFRSKITYLSLLLTSFIILLMWVPFTLDYLLDLNLYRFGVYPLEPSGLIGILTSPFIHSTRDFSHILNNTVPMFVLSWMLFYHYREIATKSFVLIYFLSGIGLWFLGEQNYHIGMSGVIYGLTSFLAFSGFFRRNMRVAAISLVVVFLYGSTVWGIFPIRENMSWEGHATGLFAGIIVALIFRKSPPQQSKMPYEIEEEMGIEPTHEFWKQDTSRPPKEEESKIIVNYTIVPEKPEPTEERSNAKDEEE